jgi:hypothetical protein
VQAEAVEAELRLRIVYVIRRTQERVIAEITRGAGA